MSLKELLLAAILQWNPQWYAPEHNPESNSDYQARLGIIAEAVALEAQQVGPTVLGTRELAAAALVVWYGETHFSYEVHALGQSRWSQDLGQARCLGQIHVSGLVPRADWDKLVGADLTSTRNCARATIRVLSAMARYCGVRAATRAGLERVFGAYGSGRGCAVSEQSRDRAQRWERLMHTLYAGAAKSDARVSERDRVPAQGSAEAAEQSRNVDL
jgi:hypothetical protein